MSNDTLKKEITNELINYITVYGLDSEIKWALSSSSLTFLKNGQIKRQIGITLSRYETVFKSLLNLDFADYSESIISYIRDGLTVVEAANHYARKYNLDVYEGSRYFEPEKVLGCTEDVQPTSIEITSEIKLKALQFASGCVLTKEYPDNWLSLTSQEQESFIDEHISADYEGWNGKSLIPHINHHAESSIAFLKKVIADDFPVSI